MPSQSTHPFLSRHEFVIRRVHSLSGLIPVGAYMVIHLITNAGERLDALMNEGGIQVCGNAQNCVAVCPKDIPLTTSIAQAGRATTLRLLKKWFDREYKERDQRP